MTDSPTVHSGLKRQLFGALLGACATAVITFSSGLLPADADQHPTFDPPAALTR